MIDWLRRNPREAPSLTIGDRTLPIVIRRLAHARRMTMRLAPDGSEVRISMPRWGATADAVDFARSRAGWLAQQFAAIPSAEPPRPGGRIAFRGEWLEIAHEAQAPRKVRVEPGLLHIGGPSESLDSRLRRWLESEARGLLTADLAHYCALAERVPPKLALSSARRRWGSCAADGAIRINWRLIMAPDFVRRSVVAHEVAHLVHFDHSPRFHRLLGDIFEGEVHAANAWLKREGQGLYRPFG